MGGISQTLTIDEVIEINRLQIKRHGGIFFEADDNLANRGSLEYALSEVNAELFGEPLHASVFEKAALLAWRIIRNHIFHDGNKCTGMSVCQTFVELNGYTMRVDMDFVDVAVKVATNTIAFEDFTAWVEARCTPQEPTPDA